VIELFDSRLVNVAQRFNIWIWDLNSNKFLRRAFSKSRRMMNAIG